MADHASSEQGQAILRFVARDFEEAADRLESTIANVFCLPLRTLERR